MRITRRSDAALRAATALAADRAARAASGKPDARPVPARELTRRIGVPRPFLEQALLRLRRGGIVASRAGRHGGYLLAKPAAEVSVGDILRLMQGTLAPMPCAAQPPLRRCPRAATCAVLPVWIRVRQATEGVVDKVSLQDLTSR